MTSPAREITVSTTGPSDAVADFWIRVAASVPSQSHVDPVEEEVAAIGQLYGVEIPSELATVIQLRHAQ